DALLLISALNSSTSGQLAGKVAPPSLAGKATGATGNFVDVNGDSQVTSIDALIVMACLNAGETTPPPVPVPTTDEQPDQVRSDVPILELHDGFARVHSALNSDGDQDVFGVVAADEDLNVTLNSCTGDAMTVTVVDAAGNQLGTATTTGGGPHG